MRSVMRLLRLARAAALAGFVTANVAGCLATPRWTLSVWNDTGQAVVVRVVVGEQSSAWLLGQDEGFVLFDRSQPLVGTIELLELATCEVVDRAALPNVTSAVSPTGDASRGPTGMKLVTMRGEDLRGARAAPTMFNGCGDGIQPVQP